MSFSITIDTSSVAARLAALGPNVKQALVAALTPIAASIEADARARAQAHIHTRGKTPGAYLASIHAGVAQRADGDIAVYAGSSSILAGWLEYGARVPAHLIGPDVAEALRFTGSAGEVFAKLVHSPGADIPAYPAIGPAFEAARDDIMSAIEAVALDPEK